MASSAASEEDVIVPLTEKELPSRARCWFPASVVPVTLFRGDKSWKGFYYGNRRFKRFNPSWKDFVLDNKLNVGDACVFELLNPKTGEFKVQILRADIEFEENAKGSTSANPILLE